VPDVSSALATPRSLRRTMPWLVLRGADDARALTPDSFLLRVDVDGAGGGEQGPERGLQHLPVGAPTYEVVA
jgi:hypothetical protein